MPAILAPGRQRKMNWKVKVFFTYTMILRLALAPWDPIPNKTAPSFQNIGSRNALQHFPPMFSFGVHFDALLCCWNLPRSFSQLTKLSPQSCFSLPRTKGSRTLSGRNGSMQLTHRLVGNTIIHCNSRLRRRSLFSVYFLACSHLLDVLISGLFYDWTCHFAFGAD